MRRGVYELLPGSRTYERAFRALAGVGAPLLYGSRCGNRWLVVFVAALRLGQVRPCWVSRWLGIGLRASYMLLRRMVRAGLLVRAGRGVYVPAFVVGVTRVDSGPRHVSVSSILGFRCHHPALGFKLLSFVDWRRGGSVEVALSMPCGPPGPFKYCQLYYYRHGGRWWFKVEPRVGVRVDDVFSLESLAVYAVLHFLSMMGPFIRLLRASRLRAPGPWA